jgi:tetratricopeptide (TPR) repeat protein
VNPQRSSLDPHPVRRPALWLVIAAVSAALAGLWWTSTRRTEINFLPGMAPAQWIVYPAAPDMRIHPYLELPTIFKTSFVLQQAPAKAPLKIAAFHRYALTINGTLMGKPRWAGRNWKQPDVFELSSQLRPGENRLEVTVFNSNAPPALWLFLDTDGVKVRSGEDWQASHAGAAWCHAVLASKPKSVPAGCAIYGGDQPWTSLRARWPILVLFALVSAAAYWVMGRLARHGSHLYKRRFWRSEIAPLVLLIGFWMALFANNLGALPSRAGYDALEHLAYVHYIQENNSLPLAANGWEMFQPPLYYLLSAKLLSLLSLSTSDSGAVLTLRLLGLSCGVAQMVVVWAALRLLFPQDASKQKWGLVLVGCLPPLLYVSQYVSNETMAATLATVCLYLCLRILRQGSTWRTCAGLGICLGAALLTKATNFLLAPVILGALLWRRLEKRDTSWSHWAGRTALVFLSAAVVCGWHYARVWRHYGNPLVGNWDSRSGFVWWMDDGYRTAAYYVRWGDVLVHPWFAGFRSFWGGIYATLWGDSLLGGAPGFRDPHPPWNYNLMAIGYWLAILPTVGLLAGAIVALCKFIGRPSAEWFLLLGFGFGVAVALVYMSLVVPCGGMVKAFYGLPALLPICALGALGLDFLAARTRHGRFLLGLFFGVWAINSFACVWILRSSQSYALPWAQALVRDNQLLQATEFLNARLKIEPGAAPLRLLLLGTLPPAELAKVEGHVRILMQQEPNNNRVWLWQGNIFMQHGQIAKAYEAFMRSVELAPGEDAAYQQLAILMMTQNQPGEAVLVCREGLRRAAASPSLRVVFAFALLYSGQDDEASAQFNYVFKSNPELPNLLNDVAWALATNEDANRRNGRSAVQLAEQACAFTQYQKPAFITTLAVAYAETGRYDAAIKTAERAQAAALASGATNLAARNLELLDLFKSRQPYRSKAVQ